MDRLSIVLLFLRTESSNIRHVVFTGTLWIRLPEPPLPDRRTHWDGLRDFRSSLLCRLYPKKAGKALQFNSLESPSFPIHASDVWIV